MSRYNFCIPSNVSRTQILSDLEDSKLWKVYYFLNLLYEVPVKKQKVYDKYLINGWVQLHSVLLKKGIGNDYKEIIDFLIGKGIVLKREDKKYKVKKYSSSFGLSEEYSLDVKVVEANVPTKVFNRLKTTRAKGRFEIPYLWKWLYDPKFTIDISGALQQLINEQLDNKYKERLLRYKLYSIMNKSFYFTRDTSGKRLHTNISHLNKDYKKHLRYDGQKLVEIDIENSQPFFSLLILQKFFGKSLNQLKELKGEYNDVPLYISLVESGLIYEHMDMEYMSSKYEKPTLEFKDMRDKIKNRFWKVLFSKEESFKGLRKVFSEAFPNVYNAFIPKTKRGLNFAEQLQRAESNIILDKVCKNINREFPECPMYTVHDSILTISEYADDVKAILKAEIFKTIATVPNLHTKQL